MAIADLFGIGAIFFGLISGLSIGGSLPKKMSATRRASFALASDKRAIMVAKMRVATKPLLPLSNRMLMYPPVSAAMDKACVLAQEQDLDLCAAELSSVLLAISFLGGLIAWLLSASWVVGLASAALIFMAVIIVINNRMDKRNLAMREAVPDALRSMATCFRSGQSLVQTMRHVSKEIDGPLGKVFAVTGDRLDMGCPSAEALAVMRSHVGIPELSFIAVALDVQHQSGGSIAPVLESARDSVESELELMRTLRIQTAQAKLSARIVTIMPFVLIFLFSMMSPDFLAPFFGSFLGMALLGLAIVMQVAGVLIVRQMLKVEV